MRASHCLRLRFGSEGVRLAGRSRASPHEQQSSEDTEKPPKGAAYPQGAYPKSLPKEGTFGAPGAESPSPRGGFRRGLPIALLFHHISSLQTARHAHSPRDGGQHRDEELDYLFPVYFHGLSCFI